MGKNIGKVIFKILKGLGITSVLLALLLAAGAYFLNTSTFQNYLVKRVTELLSEKLHTRVAVDSVSVDIWGYDVFLHGLEIEDQQQRKMLDMNTLVADVDLWALLKREVIVRSVEVKGLNAFLLKPSADEPANYQFLIDSLKPKTASAEKKKEKKFSVDVSFVKLQDVHARYNNIAFDLQHATYEKQRENRFVAEIDSLHFKTDNGRPRRNVGKPHRGFFDAGHMDMTASLKLRLDFAKKDSLIAVLEKCRLFDKVAGIDVSDVHTTAHVFGDSIRFEELVVQQKNTVVKVSGARVQLPNKKTGKTFSFSTGDISGRTQLKDISRAFSPPLKNFSLPLNFHTQMDGTDNALRFHKIRVNTDDHRLTARGAGSVTRLREKRKLEVHFNVSELRVKGDMKEKVINQFVVKKFMMKQLRKLGNISAKGGFAVRWKHLNFHGLLQTAAGPLRFAFGVDNLNKYLEGNVQSDAFQLGQVMDLPKIGSLSCQAKFKIDISKPRTAKVRQMKGGKLPIGTVEAQVDECSYDKIHLHNLVANINSDGAIAVGDLMQLGKRRALYCSFSFTATDDMKSMKITKPGILFYKHKNEDGHKMTKEEVEKMKAEKQAKKAEKKAKREEEKALKAERKAAKKAEKEKQKAEKRAAKEAAKKAKEEGLEQ